MVSSLPVIGWCPEQKVETPMRVVGIIATALAGAGVLVAAATAMFSFNDVRRYMHIRKM